MFKEEEILNTLDYCNDGFYCSFVELNHPYSYLIDSRLNVFRSDDGRWAIAMEKLGYNPRGGFIELEIYYYGNCLINLEQYNGRAVNYYIVFPIEEQGFSSTVEGEILKTDAAYWTVRGQKVLLSQDKNEYFNAGIDVKEYEPNEIRIEEAARFLIIKRHKLFRATHTELYKSIPADLEKILVLDNWFHKDFALQPSEGMTADQLSAAYDLNKSFSSLENRSFEEFEKSIRQQEMMKDEYNRELWAHNRPSSYETWIQIARVISTNDTSHYKPVQAPNSDWKNWPESGSL